MLGTIAAVLVGSTSYLYVSYTAKANSALIQENKQLQVNVDTLQQALDLQDKTIVYLQEQEKKVRLTFEQTQTAFEQTRKDNQKLKDKLKAANINKQATESPSIAENYVNQNSNELIRCFELLSGAELNDAEKAATTADEFNSQCPWATSLATGWIKSG